MSVGDFREIVRRTVSADMCDHLGHMNIQHYFATLSEGVFEIMEILKISTKNHPERRTSFVLYKENSEFIEELHDGDEFFMATALEHIGNKSMILQHRFFKPDSQQEIFRSRFVTVNMDLDKRTSVEFEEVVRARTKKELPEYIEDQTP